MWEHCASWSEPMNMKEKKAAFERVNKPYESAVLTFHGVEGFDVYNCSIPFEMNGETLMYGRVEKRNEWATSWVRLFRRTGPDEWTAVPDAMIYQLEDPYIQFLNGELVMGGTHVLKEAGKIKNLYGYFYRGASPEELRYFTTGPDMMKDIRLVPLRDGRIGVFSRPRGKQVEEKYGSGSVIGFAVIRDLSELTADVIANAPVIGNLFGFGEWGGCNQCYLLKDGRIGVIGHKCYQDTRSDGGKLAVYMNVAFIFDPETHQATEPVIIATRGSYPDAPAKLPELVDCAFTSGIVLRPDGKADLYSGIGDTHEGRVTIDNPFPGLL